MKKIISLAFVLLFFMSFGATVFATSDEPNNSSYEEVLSIKEFNSKSLLLMEAETGTVICAKNENESYSPASVTKIMTLLLVCEALNNGKISLDDSVSISSYASSMGGSQVYLEEGETLSVEELIKCTVIASANDAAVALAELVSGSESEFVENMNKRAAELGMSSTNFENVTGLDDDTENHVTSALDIAIMSRELIKNEIILKYSSLWQDTIRNGEFTLTNTNRLVRYYNGCNGLKTGSTDKAGSCISVTAKRGDMTLIAVVMGAQNSNSRNDIAKSLLDYGFANYALFRAEKESFGQFPVMLGVKSSTVLCSAPFYALVKKSDISKVEKKYSIPESINAPIFESTEVGLVEYTLNGEKIGESKIYSTETVEKMSFLQLYIRTICAILKK